MKRKILSVIMAASLVLSLFPAAVSAEPDWGAADIINSAELIPTKTGYSRIDEKVNEILSECGYGQYDTYTVVKNCYDYVIDHVEYGSSGTMFINKSTFGDKEFGYVPIIPEYYLVNALSPLFDGVGVCDNYAAEFMLLTRAIGLESYVYNGQTRTVSGGFTGHAWNEIKINGLEYVFDTQVEDNVAKGGEIQYIYFCKTEAEMEDRYQWSAMDFVDSMKAQMNKDAVLDSIDSPTYCLESIEEYEGALHIFVERKDQIGEDQAVNAALINPVDKNTVIALSESILFPAGLNYDMYVNKNGIDIIEIYHDTSVIGKAPASPGTQTGVEKITVLLDGQELSFDVPPRIINDRAMVPMRAIFEALGASVEWDAADKSITSVKDTKVITMQVDNSMMYVGKKTVVLDSPPTVINDRTLVPVRAVSEAFDCDVEWNGNERKVTITSAAS